jgi:hypothetical protein
MKRGSTADETERIIIAAGVIGPGSYSNGLFWASLSRLLLVIVSLQAAKGCVSSTAQLKATCIHIPYNFKHE